MKIHLHSKLGLFEVDSYDSTQINITTKLTGSFSVPVSDFKTFAGGSWNSNESEKTLQAFLDVVKPDYIVKVETITKVETMKKKPDIISQNYSDDDPNAPF